MRAAVVGGGLIIALFSVAWWSPAPGSDIFRLQSSALVASVASLPHSRSESVKGLADSQAKPPEIQHPNEADTALGALEGTQSIVDNESVARASSLREAREFQRWQKHLQVQSDADTRLATADSPSGSRFRHAPAAQPSLLVCEPNHEGAALIHRPVPFGFVFDPTEYAGGRIEMRNLQDAPLIMTVNGTEGIQVNGQPAVPGRPYLIDGSLEVSAPSPVRIHVRPGTASSQTVNGAG